MRKFIAVTVVLLSLSTASPALAEPRPRPPQPSSPPGFTISEVDRPGEAESPRTGGGNRYEHWAQD